MAPKKKTKGLTVNQLVKATKSIVEETPGYVKPRKVYTKREPSITLHKVVIDEFQAAKKENAKLLKEIKKLKQGVEKQNIKVTTMGKDITWNKKDDVRQEGGEAIVEDVDMDVSNLPQTLANFTHISEKVGDDVIDDYFPNDGSEIDNGVLETVGDFINSNKIELDKHSYESIFTIDTCFFGSKPQPFNKQPVINFQEKFEVIDYQLPDIPSSNEVNGEKSFTLPLISHFKVTEITKHRANFQMHNLDSLINAGFHQHSNTLSMCFSQIILASQPIELGDLAVFLDDEGDKLIDRGNPSSSLEFQERASIVPQRVDSFIYYKQSITRVTNCYDRRVDGNKVHSFSPKMPPLYEEIQSYEIGFDNMAMQSFIPGENIHGLVRLSYQNTSMIPRKDVKDGSDLVALWYDVDMPKLQIEVIYHPTYVPLSSYYENELWDSQTVSERGRSGTLTISGMGMTKEDGSHSSGINLMIIVIKY